MANQASKICRRKRSNGTMIQTTGTNLSVQDHIANLRDSYAERSWAKLQTFTRADQRAILSGKRIYVSASAPQWGKERVYGYLTYLGTPEVVCGKDEYAGVHVTHENHQRVEDRPQKYIRVKQEDIRL